MAVKGRTKSSSKPVKKKKAKAAVPKKKGAVKAKGNPKPAKKPPARPRKPLARKRGGTQIQTLRKALEQAGKPLTHWVDILDRVGGPELGHSTLVRILTETQHVPAWPANCIVLHYRGLYGFGETADLLDHQERLDELGRWK